MKKKILLLAITSSLSYAAIATALALNLSGKSDLKATEPEIYTLTLDATNVTPGASFTVNTAEGNPIIFEADGLDVVGGQLVLSQGGYIRNAVDHEIRGMAQIIPTFQGTITYDYTWGDSLKAASPYYQRRAYKMPLRETAAEHSYSFLDEAPNYVRINAVAETKFDSIVIKYSCEKTPEAGDNLVLGSAVMFERFKTVSAWGTTFAGQTVELSDDFSMNGISMTPINTFEGVFDGKGHTISDLTLSGADQTAPFRNVVGGTVKNVNFANVNVTGTSQRAAGAVGRAENALIENVTVSGSISGTKEMGGIVGVALKKTTIKNCVNNANLSCSSSTNGGILGNIYCATNNSSYVNVENCINNGNVTATASGNAFIGGVVGASVDVSGYAFYRILNCTNNGTVNSAGHYVGGVVGIARAALTGSVVANCRNNGNVTGVKYVGGITGAARANVLGCASETDNLINGSAANTLNPVGGAADTAGYLSGTKETGATYVTGALLTEAISSVAELEAYRDAVNAGTATGGAYLTADINLTSVANWTPIGTETNKFMLVFDGNGHTISNLTISGEQYLGLFGYCSNSGNAGAGIRNLNIEDASITCTGYSGILVGRMASTAISGVTVSGSIASSEMWPTGGIVGIIGANTCFITLTNNYASVSSTKTNSTTSTGTGGIAGYTDVSKTTVFDCNNYGTVNGRGDGSAGIVGSSGASTTGTGCLWVEQCNNYAAITGTNFAGGVVGLARQQSNEFAIIKDCKCYANVSGTGQNIGGVVALARINVDNCGSIDTIVVKKGASTFATQGIGEAIAGVSAGTKLGFVVGGIGYEKTVSNCYSFDANGNVTTVYPDVTAPAAS